MRAYRTCLENETWGNTSEILFIVLRSTQKTLITINVRSIAFNARKNAVLLVMLCKKVSTIVNKRKSRSRESYVDLQIGYF